MTQPFLVNAEVTATAVVITQEDKEDNDNG